MSNEFHPSELFVIGSGRSGTTILLSALDCLPGVAAVPRLAGRFPALAPVAARMARHGVGPARWHRPSSESLGLFIEAGLTQEFQTGLGHSVGPQHAADLDLDRLHSRLDSLRTHLGAETIVVKNTASCGRVPVLATSFQGAAFLHVVRHPTQVVESLLRTSFWYQMTLWWDGRSTQRYAEDERLSQEDVAAQHWSHQVSAARDDLVAYGRGRTTSVRYEDFVAAPIESLRVLEDLGLPMPRTPEVTRRIGALQIRPHGHPGPSPDAVRRAVDRYCGEVAASMGILL